MAQIKGPFAALSPADLEAVLREVLGSIDPKKARDFIVSLERTFENFRKQTSNIDWGAFTDGRWHRYIFQEIAKEALGHDDLSEDDKRDLLEGVSKFTASMDEIIGGGDRYSKAAALDAIDGAFLIAAHSRISRKTLEEYKRQRTKPANDARRADDVQDVIEERARSLLRRTSKYKGNSRAIAAAIREDVRAALRKLNKIPRGWESANSDSVDQRSIDLEINRIAKRVERIPGIG